MEYTVVCIAGVQREKLESPLMFVSMKCPWSNMSKETHNHNLIMQKPVRPNMSRGQGTSLFPFSPKHPSWWGSAPCTATGFNILYSQFDMFNKHMNWNITRKVQMSRAHVMLFGFFPFLYSFFVYIKGLQTYKFNAKGSYCLPQKTLLLTCMKLLIWSSDFCSVTNLCHRVTRLLNACLPNVSKC